MTEDGHLERYIFFGCCVVVLERRMSRVSVEQSDGFGSLLSLLRSLLFFSGSSSQFQFKLTEKTSVER